MANTLLKSAAAQRAGAAALAAYIGFAMRTTRWRIEGWQHVAPHAQAGGLLVAFWHECLALTPALYARFHAAAPGRRVHVLISHHRDGRLIAGAVQRLGATVISGSSARPDKGKTDKGGAAALRGMVAALRAGELVAVTPDGPRGPPHVAAAGLAQAAALAGVPILPVAVCLSPDRRLRSWDRMMLPLPFGRGVVVCGAPVCAERGALEAATQAATAALNEVAARAEALCRGPA